MDFSSSRRPMLPPMEVTLVFNQTLHHFQHYSFWPTTKKHVISFHYSYTLSNMSKNINHNLVLSQPFLIPIRPWESISMDFINDLGNKKPTKIMLSFSSIL